MAEELYHRLGGADAILQWVPKMYDRVLADEELSPFFDGVQLDRLRNMLSEFIASALGGPNRYSALELQGIHAGRGITPQHFSKLVGHLATVMEEDGASKNDTDEMLGQIAIYRDRIIGSANVDG